jgi:post-segregation antitoxin (ccd killing protein)
MGSYVTVSVKVRREVIERARTLGIDVSGLLRRALEEEVERRELERLKQRLEGLKDVLEAIDIERVVRHIREDRESR